MGVHVHVDACFNEHAYIQRFGINLEVILSDSFILFTEAQSLNVADLDSQLVGVGDNCLFLPELELQAGCHTH